MKVFVRRGEEARAEVPLGQYRGKIICQPSRYMRRRSFRRTTEEKVVAPMVFSQDTDGSLYGMTINLNRAVGGSLHTDVSTWLFR